jgi:hypothetical protein
LPQKKKNQIPKNTCNKGCKYLYKNYKPLKKEIEEDYRRWKDLPCSWIGRINIVKMAILSKAIYMFNVIPIKIPMIFITEIEKPNKKFIWKHKRLQIAKAILRKKAMLEVSQYPPLNYTTVTAIETAWYWHKNRHGDQWNRIEDPDMNPHSDGHLIFDKDAKNIQWRKDILFNKCWWQVVICLQKTETKPCLSSCASINSKWIKEDLSIRPGTLQLVQERAGNTLEAKAIGKDFLSRTPAAQQLRERMDTWDYKKLKSFCTTKEMVSKLKTLPTE